MSSKLLITEMNGTPPQICFRDVTDFSPTAANDLRFGSPTLVQLDLTGVTNTSWWQSTKFNFGANRAEYYNIRAALEFAATPIAGEYCDLYLAWSQSGTAGTGNAGGVSGADSAYTGYSANAVASAKQLDYIGRLVVTAQATATIQIIDSGLVFLCRERYATLVFDNESDATMHSDMVESNIVFDPIVPLAL